MTWINPFIVFECIVKFMNCVQAIVRGERILCRYFLLVNIYMQIFLDGSKELRFFGRHVIGLNRSNQKDEKMLCLQKDKRFATVICRQETNNIITRNRVPHVNHHAMFVWISRLSEWIQILLFGMYVIEKQASVYKHSSPELIRTFYFR